MDAVVPEPIPSRKDWQCRAFVAASGPSGSKRVMRSAILDALDQDEEQRYEDQSVPADTKGAGPRLDLSSRRHPSTITNARPKNPEWGN